MWGCILIKHSLLAELVVFPRGLMNQKRIQLAYIISLIEDISYAANVVHLEDYKLVKSPLAYLFREGWIASNATSLLSDSKLLAFLRRTRLKSSTCPTGIAAWGSSSKPCSIRFAQRLAIEFTAHQTRLV